MINLRSKEENKMETNVLIKICFMLAQLVGEHVAPVTYRVTLAKVDFFITENSIRESHSVNRPMSNEELGMIAYGLLIKYVQTCH